MKLDKSINLIIIYIMSILGIIRHRARSLKNEIMAIYFAAKNPQTPRFAKILILITVSYALSPIDLIPDFIPILGLIDDLIILPALIALSIRMIPEDIMIDSQIKADKEPLKLKRNWISATVIILIWLMIIYSIINIIR